MALLPRTARTALFFSALAAALGLFACTSKEKVFSATTCADPCCGGPTGIDCAENPDASCVSPGDACTAFAYGCLNGSFYMNSSVSASCSASSNPTPVFTLPDGGEALDGSVDASDEADGAIADSAIPDGDAKADAGDATLD
jgi:hypothetical protein